MNNQTLKQYYYGTTWAHHLERVRESLDKFIPVENSVSQDHSMLKFFEYSHLPPKLQAISKPFNELARSIGKTIPYGPEADMFLRKLLEAKDCAVRAAL